MDMEYLRRCGKGRCIMVQWWDINFGVGLISRYPGMALEIENLDEVDSSPGISAGLEIRINILKLVYVI
jgi:hypothetical protein